MLIALEGERPFAPPRTQFELDLDAIVTRPGTEVMTKGMFFLRSLALLDGRPVQDEGEVLRAVNLEDERIVPFKDYPWGDFMRLNCAVSDMVYGGHRSAGLRRIGRTLYSAFADSLAGRVTFGLLRNNADRVVSLGPRAWNMSGTPGEVVGESIGDCHYRYHYVGFPAEITETLAIGVIEGALAECGEVPDLRFGYSDPMNSVIDVRWARG